jgi:hypothetical protein
MLGCVFLSWSHLEIMEKSLNKWERCYRAWPTSTVHSRLDRPTAHPSIFFSSAAALAHRAEAAAAPGSCRDRCHRGFPHAATLVLASLIFSVCQASKQKSRCLSPFPRALLAVTLRVTKSLTQFVKLQLSPKASLIQSLKFGFEFKDADLRFQVLFSVDRLVQSEIFVSLFKSNQALLPKANLFVMTCSTSVQICKNY